MKTENINTKARKIKEIDVSSNEKCQNILKQYAISDKKISKYLYGKELEIAVLDDFLEENQIKFSDLVLILLFRDGAISDEMATATLKHFTKLDDSFIHEREFTFNYKEKYTKNIDDFNKSKRVYKVLKLRYVMSIEVDAYFAQKGFISFQQYMKSLLNDLGVYPGWMYEEIKKNLDTVANRTKRKKKELSEDDLNIYSASFSVSKFEKQYIFTPFNNFLQKKGLNISKVVRYEMWKLRFISYRAAKLTEREIKKIEDIKNYGSYTPKNKYKKLKEMEEAVVKKERDTVVVMLADDKEFREKMHGRIGSFVKYVLHGDEDKGRKGYGVYPTFGIASHQDSFKLFQNKKKLNDLIEIIEKQQED